MEYCFDSHHTLALHKPDTLLIYEMNGFRETVVPQSNSSERKCADDVGDRASVSPLRARGRHPSQLHRSRPCPVPTVSQTTSGRRCRSCARPGAAISVGVWSHDRRQSGVAFGRTSSDGSDVGVGVVWNGTDGGHGASRGTGFPSTDGRHRASAPRPMAEVAENLCPGKPADVFKNIFPYFECGPTICTIFLSVLYCI